MVKVKTLGETKVNGARRFIARVKGAYHYVFESAKRCARPIFFKTRSDYYTSLIASRIAMLKSRKRQRSDYARPFSRQQAITIRNLVASSNSCAQDREETAWRLRSSFSNFHNSPAKRLEQVFSYRHMLSKARIVLSAPRLPRFGRLVECAKIIVKEKNQHHQNRAPSHSSLL